MALGAEVVDFVGVYCFEHAPQSRTVGEVAVMQGQPRASEMGIVVKMINAIGIEEAGSPHQAVHFVALREQELGKV